MKNMTIGTANGSARHVDANLAGPWNGLRKIVYKDGSARFGPNHLNGAHGRARKGAGEILAIVLKRAVGETGRP